MKAYKYIVKVTKFQLPTTYRFSTAEGRPACGQIPPPPHPSLFRVKAKLGRNMIKSDIYDMSKNGKFLHEVYTSAELELVNSSEKYENTLT